MHNTLFVISYKFLFHAEVVEYAGWLIKNKTLQRYEMMLEFSVAKKIKTNQLFILPRCFELFLEHKIVKKYTCI